MSILCLIYTRGLDREHRVRQSLQHPSGQLWRQLLLCWQGPHTLPAQQRRGCRGTSADRRGRLPLGHALQGELPSHARAKATLFQNPYQNPW